jgi:DNA helicase-2/ATP-dependent DNA helicase PcrA
LNNFAFQKKIKNVEFDFLKELNEAQYKAVTGYQGPSLVIAGAGSGKTRVLTYRIAYLLAKGVNPHAIMALTFTNKAAREMKERIAHLVDPESARKIWMGTFHSIFYRILRLHANLIGFSGNFTILDPDDAKNMIRKIVKELLLDEKAYKPGDIFGRISRAKNDLLTPSEYRQNAALMKDDLMHRIPETARIYEIYYSRCRLSDAMDFDDLLLYTFILFKNFPEVLNKYQYHFQYLLVDEYQDTNHAQYVIMKGLSNYHRNLCVVGDDAQSIYSFRGARIENILRFEKDYPDFRLFKLERNYRSTQTIVKAANNLISKNNGQIPKTLFSEETEGEPITVIASASDTEESHLVADKISELKKKYHNDYSDFAILYRTNAQSRSFEDAFRRKNIPYKIYGGLSFYQRKEIKDLVAYLKLTVNPRDNEALKRIINFPVRGIGKTTIDKVEELAHAGFKCMWEILCDSELLKSHFNGGVTGRLERFVAMMKAFTELSEQTDAGEFAKYVLASVKLFEEYEKDSKTEFETRKQNLEEMINSVYEFTDTYREETGTEKVPIAEYLQNVSLMTDADKNDKDHSPRVSLMTVHSAKGLEFDCVFIVGAEKELFPLYLNSMYPAEVEEERRLFYVALTRAQRHAVITHCAVRMRWGSYSPSSPSPFIRELGDKFLHAAREERSPGPLATNPFPRKKPGVAGLPPVSAPRNLKPVRKTVQSITSTEVPELTSGMKVEHERFGRGTVISIDGIAPDTRAQIEFEHSGLKNLLLKFAKIKIIPN